MQALLRAHRVDATVHFAAFKAVGESTAKPLAYYANNLGGLLAVCETMRRHGAEPLRLQQQRHGVWQPETLPIDEDAPLAATNPYGQTKLMAEQILRDLGAAEPAWQTACLRYFNPVGAHESGAIGEDPRGVPNNLMPYVAQVAIGRRPRLQVFGHDYPTPDGTGVRDYIHVMDLAEGHVAALRRLLDAPGSFTVNLGTGRRLQRARRGARVRASERPAHSLRTGTPSPRRRGRLLCRSSPRRGAVGLARAAGSRHDVRRQLALAAAQPRRVRVRGVSAHSLVQNGSDPEAESTHAQPHRRDPSRLSDAGHGCDDAAL